MDAAQKQSALAETTLGLDLGTNSLGWCLLSAEAGRPTGLIAAGARAFEAGMEGDISVQEPDEGKRTPGSEQ